MSNPEGFFGSIFGSAEDDPLLQSDREAMQSNGNGNGHSDSSTASRTDRASQSSRDTDSRDRNRKSDATHAGRQKQQTDAMEVQEVILHQHGNETEGLADLNEAVEDGWRLSHISLDDRIRSASGDVDTEIVVLMERNTPRSLFDFGGTY